MADSSLILDGSLITGNSVYSGPSSNLLSLSGGLQTDAVPSLANISSGSLDAFVSSNTNSADSGINTVDALTITASNTVNDVRIRLKAPTGQEDQIYGPSDNSSPMNILRKTNGLLFPYTPSIQFSQDVDYRSTELTHANGDIFSYSRTPSVSLSVAGKFTVQNQREGEYAIAVVHFLRACSKMYFGETDDQAGLAGLPPPVLVFTGYGNYMFNDLKVILRSHSYSLDDNVDYIDITTAASSKGVTARLPSMFTISMNLSVIQTPNAMRTTFSLTDFISGKLMNQTGWI